MTALFILTFWRTYQGDEARTGAVDFVISEEQPTLLWADTLTNPSAPVVGPNGNVYLASNVAALVKLDGATGDTLWLFEGQGNGLEPIPPTLTEDGSKVFSFVMFVNYGGGGIVNCLTSDGDSLWSVILNGLGAWLGSKGGVNVGDSLYVPDMANPHPRLSLISVSQGQVLASSTAQIDTGDYQWVAVNPGYADGWVGGGNGKTSLNLYNLSDMSDEQMYEERVATVRVGAANPANGFFYHPSDSGLWFYKPGFTQFKVNGKALAVSVINKPAQVYLFVAFPDSLTALDGEDGSSLEWSEPLSTSAAVLASDTALHVLVAYNGKLALYKFGGSGPLWEVQLADTAAKPRGIALAQVGDSIRFYVVFNDKVLYALAAPSMEVSQGQVPQAESLTLMGSRVLARGEGILRVYSVSGRLLWQGEVRGQRELKTSRFGKGVFVARFGKRSLKFANPR